MGHRQIAINYDLCETRVTIYSSRTPFKMHFVKSYNVNGQWISREAATTEECIEAVTDNPKFIEDGYAFHVQNGIPELSLMTTRRRSVLVGDLPEGRAFYRQDEDPYPNVEDRCYRRGKQIEQHGKLLDFDMDTAVWLWG